MQDTNNPSRNAESRLGFIVLAPGASDSRVISNTMRTRGKVTWIGDTVFVTRYAPLGALARLSAFNSIVLGNDRRGAALLWPIVALRKQQRTAQNRLIVRRKQH